MITTITHDVLQNANGELEREQRKNQLRILSQLRNLVSVNIEIMESVSTFFKKEKDFLYRIGQKEGIERGMERGMEKGIEKGMEKGIIKGEERARFELVKNLLVETEFTVTKIATLAAVSETFVRKVKKTLK